MSYVKFDHHYAHAANASFTSPFDEAACMIVDGYGEGGSISYFEYRKGRLRERYRVKGEKASASSMGFAPVSAALIPRKAKSGSSWDLRRTELIRRSSKPSDPWSRSTDSPSYPSLRSVKAWFDQMKTFTREKKASPMDLADLAYTTQHFYTEVMTKLLNNLYALRISDNLTIGGGCALILLTTARSWVSRRLNICMFRAPRRTMATPWEQPS